MFKPFLRVLSLQQARELTKRFRTLGTEEVSLNEALFRVTAAPVRAREDMPSFPRSTMDGFAVRASDTFGASETSPALFRVVGEVLMGEMPDRPMGRGDAVRIWTGGSVPADGDAVVMIEHTEALNSDTIEILKAVAPFENVVRVGEDFRTGEVLLGIGHRLRPQDLGLLAAMGKGSAVVFRKPVIALMSSGDEIVPVEQEPPLGCMRDVNRYTLTACTVEARATPLWIGIAPDNLDRLSSMIKRGLDEGDAVLISGGSSMGSRDLVIEAITSYDDSEILLHGVSVSPGKPLIVGRVGSTPVVGLPGHPTSAMVCFDQFVVPLIRRLEGEETVTPFLRPTIAAFLTRNVPSREGRTDFVRVRLREEEGSVLAVPVLGKSGMISPMARAHGFFCIAADSEGLYRGDQVTVHLYSDWLEEDLEKKYLSRHEVPCRGSGDIFESPAPEKLSGT